MPADGTSPQPVPSALKKSRAWLYALIGGVAVVLVAVAVVLVLIFVVFKGGSPEDTVGRLWKAFTTKNTNTAMETFDPEYFKDDKKVKDIFAEELFKGIPDGMKVVGLQYETDIRGDKATVTVVEGLVMYPQDGKIESSDLSQKEDKNVYELVKKNGRWYISTSAFADVVAKAYVLQSDESNEALFDKYDKLYSDGKSFHDFITQTPEPSASQMRDRYVQLEQGVRRVRAGKQGRSGGL